MGSPLFLILIAVVMADDERISIMNIPPVLCQPLLGGGPANPRVKKQPRIVRFDINAVAIRAAL